MSDLYGIAKSGLKAYKESLATTGQNIANVGNENYARREANLSQIKSASSDVLSISSNTSYGVKVDGITRAFDQFIDIQLQEASSGLSSATSQTLVLEQLEKVLRPNDYTVSKQLQEFFANLSTVSQDPSDLAARHIAIDSGKAVANSIRTVATGILDLRKLVRDNIDANVIDFNNKIVALNNIQKEILGNTSAKSTPNDLFDQRDALLKDLSEIAAISVDYQKNGSVKVTMGTSGQAQTLISGLTNKKLHVEQVDGSARIFLKSDEGPSRATIQIKSGEIAGNLAADVTLKESKKSLDNLTKRLVDEFNELHKFGVDLDGEQGQDFFGLDAIEIKKVSPRESMAQLRVEGQSTTLSGSVLTVSYQSDSKSWNIYDEDGGLYLNFERTAELHGLRFNFEGAADLGDSFQVSITDDNSVNLRSLLGDGRQIAASSFYSVEPGIQNSSDASLSISKFNPQSNDTLTNLGEFFDEPRNSANPVSFRNNGAIGYLANVDSVSELTSLKSQPKLQFSAPFTDLDTNSKLKINLGGTEHIFSIGGFIDDVSSYSEIANRLNIGAIKSNSSSLTFSDLGLIAGGNSVALTVTSDEQADIAQDGELGTGTLNSISGISIPADTGNAPIQIFTREGLQISGEPISEAQASFLLTEANGFSKEAEYSAAYLAMGSNSGYVNADIDRRTTTGLQSASITAVGFSNNLNVYASNAFPTSRAGLTGDVTFATDAGYTKSVSSAQGMMAGQIAAKINDEVGEYGLNASASNKLELYNISDGRIQFNIFADNSEASAIDVNISGGDTASLVDAINIETSKTGVTASVSGYGSILLNKLDGNEISLKDFSIAVGNISSRQIDEFGEAIQATPSTITSGDHIVSGGQINIKSPSSFSVTYNAQTNNSSVSSFDDSFVEKVHDIEDNKTVLSFFASSKIDESALDDTRSQGVVASSSYKLELGSDTSGSLISGTFKPKEVGDFSSSTISNEIVSQIRLTAPGTRFSGDVFTLNDGFPANGQVIEFKLGEQQYTATLNNSLEYTLSGSDVIIGNETLSLSEGLERLVSASSFSISGPEDGRITVGFEKSGAGFRLFAAAKDGILTGHPLIASDTNSAAQYSAFHISNTSTSELISSDIDLTQTDKANFAEILIGTTTYSFSFDGTSNTVTLLDASGNAPPATINYAIVANSTDQVSSPVANTATVGKLKITIANNVSDKEMRLKANDDSGTFGIATAGAQLTLAGGKIEISNYDNQRISSASTVTSLAEEIVSIENMSGEDLIIISNGTRKPTLIGEVKFLNQELNPREMTAKVDIVDSGLINIFDKTSGDLLGSRRISSSNNFLFRGFDWVFNGDATAGDEYSVLTNNLKADDATNLQRLMELASFSDSTGRGGYSAGYNDLVTTAGFQLRASEQNLETSKVKFDVAMDRKSEFSGVDLDTEAAKLLEQQQAYQALARVLTTAKELLDTLLRSM